jgi:hypothetical protein
MSLTKEALRHDDGSQPDDVFAFRSEGHRNPAPPPPTGALKKLLTLNKSQASPMDDFPSERKGTAVKIWVLSLLGVVVVFAAAVAASLVLTPLVLKWRANVAVPTTGQLAVVSQPAGGQVIVDGEVRGTAPLTIALTPGTHALQLTRGEVSRNLSVAIKAGAEATQYVDLESQPVQNTGQLVVTSEPAGARVTIDGQPQGVTPLTLAVISAGRHDVVVQGASGSVNRTVTVQRGESSSLLVSMSGQVAFGWVSVFSPMILQVLEDDRKLGTSETDRIVLPAGQHTLRLLNSRVGFQTSRVVHVPAGAGASVKIDPPSGVANLNALPWAEAWIDGRSIGETPLGNVTLPLGEHEVLFRHPQLGERRQTFLVTANEPARVSVDFSK